MRRALCVCGLAACIAIATASLRAQGGGKPVTGNPTPGVAQPDPPSLADRITVVGCLRPATDVGSVGANEARDANTPSDSRYVLTSAERQDRVPPGTGGSTLAASAAGKTYRLEGIESQFSPFVGVKVEISGEVKAAPSTTGARNPAPTLLVEFVQKLSPKCS